MSTVFLVFYCVYFIKLLLYLESRRSTKDDHSVGMDEFGIIHRDERSKSSDSVPVEDPSMHLTDDDLSARIFEVSTTSRNARVLRILIVYSTVLLYLIPSRLLL